MKKRSYLKTGIKVAIGVTILLWLWNTIFGEREREELSREVKRRIRGDY